MKGPHFGGFMKIWAVALAVVVGFSLSARAGKVKEIYILTTESVLEHLGLEWDEAELSNIRFIDVKGYQVAVYSEVDLAVKKYTCITTFVETGKFWQVDYTECK